MLFGTYNLSNVYPTSAIEAKASKYIQGAFILANDCTGI